MIINPSSFKDPDAFVNIEGNEVYRKINKCYLNTYKKLMNSDLYDELKDKNLIIEHKQISGDIIKLCQSEIEPKTVLDPGNNNGLFLRIFSSKNTLVYSFDVDHFVVEENCKKAKANNETNIFPLIYDLINPSPFLGRKNSRLKNIDLTFAFALIHHLRIANNIPLCKIAEFFGKFSKYLIIEFINKQDSKVKQMLKNRKDIFDDYNEDDFEDIFKKIYIIKDKKQLVNSYCTIYLMEKINDK